MDPESVAAWDRYYESGDYLRHWDYRWPSAELVAVLAALGLPPGATALDLGCGAGREAVFLAQCGFRTIGVDFSPRALEIARQRAREARVEVDWRLGTALALPLDDAAADFANDRGCLHHVAEDDRGRYAREAARVLKRGAALLLRGCDGSEREGGFVPVTQASIDRWFLPAGFACGPVLPIALVSDAGTLTANVAVLRRA